MNWATIVFNNLYNELWDLFALTKPRASKINTEFSDAQIMDILLQNWFLVGLTFIVLDLEEDDEGATTFPLEIRTLGGTKVPGMLYWCAPIDLDEDMENVEELGGTNTQPKTSLRSK